MLPAAYRRSSSNPSPRGAMMRRVPPRGESVTSKIDRRLKHLENGLIVQFDLITAGDRMLETYAEILQLRMPLKRDEKVENLELMQPKHGFHILAWIHHMMKKHFPEFMEKVTPSLPTLKVF